jgi:hypothetical protein
VVKRDVIQPWMGNSGTLLAEAHAKIDFEVELAGSGTAGTAPGWGALMQACGFSQTIVATTSVTYSPVSAVLPSVTIYYYLDGQVHKLTGCRGDMSISMAKQISTIKFSMTGFFAPATTVVLPTGTVFSTQAEPIIPGSTNMGAINLFGYAAPAIEKFDFKLGNKVAFVNRIGAGGQYVYLTDRAPSGSVDFEAVTPDVKDFFTMATSAVNQAFSFTLGTVAGNKVAINCPSCDVLNPAIADNNGVQMMTIPFDIDPVAGNDDLTIVVT